jgi:hypothetical protein
MTGLSTETLLQFLIRTHAEEEYAYGRFGEGMENSVPIWKRRMRQARLSEEKFRERLTELERKANRYDQLCESDKRK